jgi:hypothetical protein
MNEIALRPRSATEIVDAALQVFRRDPIQFMLATAAVYVPWLVLRLVFDLGVSPTVPTLQQALVTLAAAVVVYALVGGVVSVIASDVYLGAPADAMRGLAVTFARTVPLLVTGVVTMFFTVIGAVLFLLPALYPIARYFAVQQAVVLENATARAALARSSELSLGVKRHVLGTLFLVLLITTAISLGAGLLLGVVESRVVTNVALTAVHVVIYPFFGIAETLLYYDIRIRKEGFDVEYLARSNPPVPADQPGAPL